MSPPQGSVQEMQGAHHVHKHMHTRACMHNTHVHTHTRPRTNLHIHTHFCPRLPSRLITKLYPPQIAECKLDFSLAGDSPFGVIPETDIRAGPSTSHVYYTLPPLSQGFPVLRKRVQKASLNLPSTLVRPGVGEQEGGGEHAQFPRQTQRRLLAGPSHFP